MFKQNVPLKRNATPLLCQMKCKQHLFKGCVLFYMAQRDEIIENNLLFSLKTLKTAIYYFAVHKKIYLLKILRPEGG